MTLDSNERLLENCTITRGIEVKKVYSAKFRHAITRKGNINELRSTFNLVLNANCMY